MAFEPSSQSCQLPLIPAEVLKKHRVFEAFDNRFRACARLLQALWRESQQLPIGSHETRDGRQRRIGSLISSAAADAGRNFLSPEVAHLVRRETIYQERGALIDKRRLYGNLLSSMPLAFNVFAPLRLNRRLAEKVIRSLIPGIDLSEVLDVRFEHSPGRNHAELTDDRTAFDVAIQYRRSDGGLGLLAIEVKYSETGAEGAGELSGRYDELAVASELYKSPLSAVLRTAGCQQLFREHLLTFAALYRGDYAEARFILAAPRQNHLVQQAAQLYASHLLEPGPGAVPFMNVELEQLIEAIGWAGELDYAYALHDRYLNWFKLDAVVEEALRAKPGSWTLAAPPVRPPLALVSRAA
ncbi:hypothetical protein [Sphingomonas sp. LHG3406-1]|uniref:PGN_0703 family putative restriction endonuclease n=1 Tax=Sphingomonas sp. LHG3406-1 TaxID=2804617 RepID=UPI00261C5CE1|nr:hypothetical protein [Sphingomonas sp. LHG3406-1]